MTENNSPTTNNAAPAPAPKKKRKGRTYWQFIMPDEGSEYVCAGRASTLKALRALVVPDGVTLLECVQIGDHVKVDVQNVQKVTRTRVK